MKKSFFKKTLAILLSIMLVLAALGGSFAVFADEGTAGEAADPYGTEADGMTQETAGTHYPSALLETPANLDFSQGLKYWGPKNDKTGKASDYFEVIDGVASIKAVSQFDGIRTANFKLPYASANDAAVLIFKHRHDVQTGIWLYEVPASYAESGDNQIVFTQGWAWEGVTEVMISANSGMIKSADSYFYIQIQTYYNCDAGDITFDDFYVAKPNVDGTYTDLATGNILNVTKGQNGKIEVVDLSTVYGTETDGIAKEGTNHTPYEAIPATDNLKNNDFSEGLKYWGPKNDRAGSAGTYAYVEDSNLILKSSAQSDGIRTVNFKLPYAEDGDYPVIITNAIHENAVAFLLTEIVNHSTYECKGVVNNQLFAWAGQTAPEVKILANTAAITFGDSLFTVQIQCNNTAVANGINIDYFYIAKPNADGTYTDLSTGKILTVTTGQGGSVVVSDPTDPEEPEVPDEPELPADEYGTVSDGITKNGNAHYPYLDIEPTVGLQNGDFSEGLRYWGPGNDMSSGTNAGTFATVADGVLTLKCANTFEKLRSVYFTLPYAEAGDTPVLLSKSLHKVGINIWVYECATEEQLNNNMGTKLIEKQYSAWADETQTQVQPSTGLAQISSKESLFYVQFQCNGNTIANGITLDDLYIAKLNSDGTYTDLSTGEILLVNTTDPGSITKKSDLYGTVEDGLTQTHQGSQYKNVPAADALINGDFSEGLKYWGPGNDRTGKASDFAKVVDGKLVLKCAAQYDKVRTVAFKLPYAAAGDVPMLMYEIQSTVQAKITLTEVKDTSAYGDTAGLVAANAYAHTTRCVEILSKNNGIEKSISSGASYFYIQIENAVIGTDAVTIDNIKVVKKNADATYTDLSTGEIVYANDQPIGGTAEDGVLPIVSPSGTSYPTGLETKNYTAIELFDNGDFSQGLKYWAVKQDTYGHKLADGTTIQKPADIAEIIDGKLTVKATADIENNAWNGLQTLPFALSEYVVEGDKLYLRADSNTTGGANVWLIGANESAIINMANIGAWETHISSTYVTVNTVNDLFSIKFQANDNAGGTQFDNFEILRADRGGVDKAVTLDGKLLAGDLYGDANGDGKVDLIDLVRAKKHSADNSVPVFTAAADIDLSGVVDANDYIEIIDYILGTKAPAEGIA